MSESFNKDFGLIVVPVALTGRHGQFVFQFGLDTGATTTTVNRRVLEIAGYDVDGTGVTTEAVTGSGVETAPLLTISQLDALGVVKQNHVVIALTLPSAIGIDGLLGLDFCRGRKLLIDFNVGRVSLD